MGKNIWLSADMHQRKFASDNVRPYVRPPLNVSGCEIAHLLATTILSLL